jgi:hypothetical protein
MHFYTVFTLLGSLAALSAAAPTYNIDSKSHSTQSQDERFELLEIAEFMIDMGNLGGTLMSQAPCDSDFKDEDKKDEEKPQLVRGAVAAYLSDENIGEEAKSKRRRSNPLEDDRKIQKKFPAKKAVVCSQEVVRSTVALASKASAVSLADDYRKYSKINLIPLPSPGYHAGVRDVWNVWNTKLRNLDSRHRNLIEEKESLRIQYRYTDRTGRWFTKYRVYKEVGEEIDRRMKDGQRLDEAIDQLDLIRWSIPYHSIQRLVDGLRHARGDTPFNKKIKNVIDIRHLLKDDKYKEVRKK